MAPRMWSRYGFCEGYLDENGRKCLSEREPYRYRALEDNVVHVVAEGETLSGLAHKYFQPMERAAGLWWVIADFQIDPIFDPTIALAAGTVLVIPSLRTVLERIFNEARRSEEVTA